MSTEPFRRGQVDCAQDRYENCPFASVGGLEARARLVAPSYISKDQAGRYLEGYAKAALEMYGEDWQTCKFTWRHVLTIPGKEGPMATKFKPLHDNVLVKRKDAETITKGGLHIPQTNQKKSRIGEVIAVGPGRFIEGSNEKRRAIGLEVGQTVCFQGAFGHDIELDGEEGYVILREEEIEGIVEEP